MGGRGGKRGMGSEVAPPPLPSGPPGPHGECVQGVYGGHRHLRRVSARCCRLCPFPFYCPPPPSSPPAILPERDEGSVAMRVPVQPRDGKVAEPGAGSGRAGGGGAGAEGGRRRTRRRQRGESEGGRARRC